MMRTRALLLLSLATAAALSAQPQRTFVSSAGNDANPCSRTAPCRNFPAAIAAVAGGGEVIVLDSAGYGAFAIDKSVSITAPDGVYAGVTAFAGDAIGVNAPGASVNLRGLTVNGLGGTNGLNVAGAVYLSVRNCTFSGFGPAGAGVVISPATSYTEFVIEDSESNHSQYGFLFGPATYGTVARSSANFSSSTGFYVHAATGFAYVAFVEDHAGLNFAAGIWADGAVQVDVRNCALVYNYSGVATANAASLSVCGSLIGSNTFAFYNQGSMVTCGDNQVHNNSTNVFGTTPASLPTM